MGNITVAFVFVMFLNVLVFLSQTAMSEVNPASTVFYNFDDSILDNYDTGNASNRLIDVDGLTDQLPAGEGSLNPETGNYFTDIFSSIKSWIVDKTGIKYIKAMLLSPYTLIKAMGLPNSFSFAIGVLWYAITLFIAILFFWGRD